MLCALVKAITAGRKGQEKILSLVCGISCWPRPWGLWVCSGFRTFLTQRPRSRRRPAGWPVRRRMRQKRQMAAIISEEAASYILDKADALGLQLEVQVELDAELLPCGVRLQGAASPMPGAS